MAGKISFLVFFRNKNSWNRPKINKEYCLLIAAREDINNMYKDIINTKKNDGAKLSLSKMLISLLYFLKLSWITKYKANADKVSVNMPK